MEDAPALEFAETAALTGSLTERAQWMLERLRRVMPFEAAWVGLADPLNGAYRSLVAVDFERGAQRPAWGEQPISTGPPESLTVALFTTDHRHVGFLVLLCAKASPPTAAMRLRLHQLTPVLAQGVDPFGLLASSARVLGGACAGAALCRDGTARPLPGFADDTLLAEGSPVTAASCAYLADGLIFVSFLWPRGDATSSREHVRVTALASPAGAPAGLLGAIVLAPATDLSGLTPRELEVLGLVIEGLSNRQIAHALVITARTVATHLEHIMAKLDAPTRTLAAVRAERRGLYVPSSATSRAPRELMHVGRGSEGAL